MKMKLVKMIALMAAVTLSGCSAGTLENTGNSASDSAANIVSSNKKASSSTKGSNTVSSIGTAGNTASGAAGNTANSTAGNTTGDAAGNTIASTAGNTTAGTAGNTTGGAAGNTTASTAGNATAGTTSNTTTATTDATSDILSTTTITLYDSDGNTVSVERTIYKNYDCEYVDADGMEYSTDDDVYFTDENGEVLKAEKRQVIHSINTSLERLVIEELISGPSQEGLMPTPPAETKLLNISTTENICYINFDSGFLQNTLNVKEYIPVYSIVNSLVENTDVNRVQISINGANDGLLKDIFPLNRLFEQNQDYIAAEE